MKKIKLVIFMFLFTIPLYIDAQSLLTLHAKMLKERRKNKELIQKRKHGNDTIAFNNWLQAQKEEIERETRIKRQDSIEAERGNVSDKLNYVLKYYDNLGKGEKEYFLRKSANGGNDTARCYLAQSLYFNCTLDDWLNCSSKDVQQAYDLLLKSEREGSKLCNYLLGVIYYNGSREANINRDYVKAVKYFLSVDANSQYYRLSRYYLFKCYRYGRGVQANIEKAMQYLKEANTERKILHKQALERTSREEIEDVAYLYNILKEEQ